MNAAIFVKSPFSQRAWFALMFCGLVVVFIFFEKKRPRATPRGAGLLYLFFSYTGRAYGAATICPPAISNRSVPSLVALRLPPGATCTVSWPPAALTPTV